MGSSKNKSPELALLYYEEKLYKRRLDEPYLLGVSPKDAFTILKQTHGRLCGSHSGGRFQAIRIKKLGYFWPTIADDSE